MSQTAVCDTCGSAPVASQRRDGSQSLDLQRAALRAEGIDEAADLYHDVASGMRGVSSASTRRCCSPVDGNASGAHGDAVPALPALRDDLPVLRI